MKYRVEVTDNRLYSKGCDDIVVFISDPIEEEELVFEILPILLKPSMFGNPDYFRVSIIPA